MRTIVISLLVLIGFLAIVVAAILLIASRLPEQHSASRSIRLKQKPADVYALVTDFPSATSWRTDIKSIEMLPNADGHARFRENGSHAAVNYEVVENIPERKVVTRIVDQDLGYSGSWTYAFESVPEGTRLRITEDGVVSNLLFRFMSRYVFGYTGSIEGYLKSVAKRFGEDVLPEN